ncbi:MAG: lipoprotein, partial [Parabacteroides sp.]|nr:lipoprotein [Parabacteroides sp.]
MKKILPFFLLVLLLASCQKDPDTSKLSNEYVVYT